MTWVRVGRRTAVIATTSNHLFWDASLNKWVPAAKLRKGEALKTPSGQRAVAWGGKVPANPDGWMWDLTVTTDHDFYVQAATTDVPVHNCGSGGTGSEQLPLFDESSCRVAANGGSQPTTGVLEIDGETIPLVSRAADPANYPASGHVEGQAALIMQSLTCGHRWALFLELRLGAIAEVYRKRSRPSAMVSVGAE